MSTEDKITASLATILVVTLSLLVVSIAAEIFRKATPYEQCAKRLSLGQSIEVCQPLAGCAP